MNTMLQRIEGTAGLQEFRYRLLYLRPSPYSDERIAVGVVAAAGDHLEVRFISSSESLGLLTTLFGHAGLEQFHFATAELRRATLDLRELDSLIMPSNLLITGESCSAVTTDRTGLLTSILASSSCLVRTDSSRSSEVGSAAPNSSLSKDLFVQLSRLNPLVAQDVLNKKVTIETGETVDIPIFGTKIFGAPVSFAVKDHRIRAESYVAKFVWLRKHLPQKPRVYVLTSQDRSSDGTRVDSGVRELRAIAEASDVPLKLSESTEEMATLILQDEAA